ncbi:MAG: ribosome maturation factor RimP [Clostridiales bacterium]|nr:ribosome maturation factor RimP [Clostridiales bacterium]
MAKKKRLTVDYNRIEQQVWTMAKPVAEALGLELIDVEYVKEAGNYYLRLFIDRDPPVDHNCCQSLSELIGEALDRHNPIGQSYFLEVSSPGLARTLKREADFIRFAGRQVDILLYAAWEGKKEYRGILHGLTENYVLIEENGLEKRIPCDAVARVCLAVDFK